MLEEEVLMLQFKKMCCMCCLMCLISSVVSAQELYEWKHTSFQYPNHWKIVADEGDDVRQVRLMPNDRDDVSLLFSLFGEFPEPDEKYNAMPVQASVSFGLGLALKLAGEAGERAIALHYGNIELSNGSFMSARFTIMPPEADTFHMLESFHAYNAESGGGFMGMVMTQGLRGQLIDDLRYIQYINEAYEIVRSLVIR